jgi:hypothetical protein
VDVGLSALGVFDFYAYGDWMLDRIRFEVEGAPGTVSHSEFLNC